MKSIFFEVKKSDGSNQKCNGRKVFCLRVLGFGKPRMIFFISSRRHRYHCLTSKGWQQVSGRKVEYQSIKQLRELFA